MKAAHAQNRNKTEPLGVWLAAYRATPNSATGIAPGDIQFRHGYGNTFPKKSLQPTNKCRRHSVRISRYERIETQRQTSQGEKTTFRSATR